MRMSWLYFAFVRCGEAAGLDLAGVRRHREIGDRRVLGLAGAMADDRRVAGAVRDLHHLERLGERADLVELDQDRVGDAALDAADQPLGIGNEHIVADKLHFARRACPSAAASRPSHPRRRPSSMETIGIARHQVGEVADHALGIEVLALAGHLVAAVAGRIRWRRSRCANMTSSPGR